ncbi:MAG: dipeptide epimerase [Verrucomicrobia bacterium]|nr:MAG: dipeptide epimerase [Verrucomicrobiota bacterium]
MEIISRRVDLELVRTWTIARGSAESIPVVVTEITTCEGVRGLGEASPISRYGESVETVENFLRRVDPARLSCRDIAGSMTYLNTLSPHDMAAKCAVNLALVDAAGRDAKQAVYDQLGLGFREGVHVTSFSIGIDSPAVIREKVLAAAEYPVLKLKVGVPDDHLMVSALREVAPKKPIRVDANEGWLTKEEALKRIEWLAADGKVQFVEQPMPAKTPVVDLVWLKERSPLPLFADESYHTAADVEHCAQCFHGVNVKLAKTAGVTGAFEALKAARAKGLKTMIGCMIETSVLISAAAHLSELADHLDLDGNLLIKNDPYAGVTAPRGVLSFASAPETSGLRVRVRNSR